ncbi:MAG: isoleucine--tRNA ligase [Candidatus Zixiibacteriota bacterium]
MKFDPLKDNFSLPAAEEKILAFWDEHQVFARAKKVAENRPEFVFYEGPPTANGKPGIHHVISRTVKDLVCRYKAMQGFRVDRKAGWDTHGLPVEIEVEKQLGFVNKAQVIEYGIAQFNQKCRESVFRYLEDWNRITHRIGYWLDLDDAYITLKNEYIESVWHILKNLYDRGLIYQGHKTVPFCPRCGTAISSHEVAQGYELVKDPSLFVKMKAADGDFSYLVWTTTPWTLPSNAALCMKADADYVTVRHQGEKLVMAEALVMRVLGPEVEILARHKGAGFVKRRYIPLFDFYKEQSDKAFYVITGEFVTLDDGTGIVHIAPGFGADDYEIGQKYGLPVLQAIEANGLFKAEAGKYAGMFVKDADPVITDDLKKAGKLYKKELYEHNYPFCWRCDSPLIYIARESWYIRTTQFKEQLIKNNNAISWVPDEIRTGRMLDWLENNVDWALSRERFWGTPLPIWVCDSAKCGKMRAVGSIAQLKEEAVACPDDIELHRPMIDEIKLECECGGSMTRVPELIDVWFDSGAMPYAQWHYPFENKEVFERKYPADFISEAVDQTRGWFYSLLAISTMLFDKAPFKNVVVLEFVLDKEGKKMSKHKGNVVDPFEAIAKYGADPLRWYLVSNSSLWVPTRFDFDGLQEVIRKHYDTLRNTYSFFAIYANIDNVLERAHQAGQTVEQFLESKAGEPEMFDRWIISRYHSLVKDTVASLDAYELTRPVRAIQNFVVEELSNWYVRNNRRRFWAEADDPSKMRAYLTLYRVLEGICRLSAPISPMVSELLWTELTGERRAEIGLALSVHMAQYPKGDESLIDRELEDSMGMVEKLVQLGRAARTRKNLKVRQPLAKMMVSLPGKNAFEKLAPYLGIIRDELNVKEVVAADNLDEYISYSAKLNFKTAGPMLGADVKTAAAYVAGLASGQVNEFATTGTLQIESLPSKPTLTAEHIEVIRTEKQDMAVEADGGVVVALDTKIDDALRDEGFAREIVNKVQNMRKTSGFEVTDNILIRMSASERLRRAADRHGRFIQRETLAHSLEFVPGANLTKATEWDINGEKAAIEVVRL